MLPPGLQYKCHRDLYYETNFGLDDGDLLNDLDHDDEDIPEPEQENLIEAMTSLDGKKK